MGTKLQRVTNPKIIQKIVESQNQCTPAGITEPSILSTNQDKIEIVAVAMERRGGRSRRKHEGIGADEVRAASLRRGPSCWRATSRQAVASDPPNPWATLNRRRRRANEMPPVPCLVLLREGVICKR